MPRSIARRSGAFLRICLRCLGRAMAALEKILATLQLDYAGVDFALSPDGRVQLFEANATLVLAPPGPEAIWDYRPAAAGAVLDACR